LPPIPPFTRNELSAAFALVVADPHIADRLAIQWFDEIAGADVDSNGRFFHRDWTIESVATPVAANGLVVVGSGGAYEAPAEAQQRYWAGWTVDRKSEYLLRLSDFHLALVARVSAELFERMRLARRLTGDTAARSREQLQAIARALRG
jgi:hypothetical protein